MLNWDSSIRPLKMKLCNSYQKNKNLLCRNGSIICIKPSKLTVACSTIYKLKTFPIFHSKRIKTFIKIGHVPVQFGLSYTVPLVKVNSCTKNLSVDDFRGISICYI